MTEQLRRLDPPPAGHARVYRGQTADFPTMLPSGCRPNVPATTKIWDIALLGLQGATPEFDFRGNDIEMVMNLGFWFKVLAQHYGPGSPYLDVTSSVEVALWFALNGAQSQDPEQALFASEPGLGDVRVRCSALSYSQHVGAPGWFYVLDVPSWDGELLPDHAELVDLASGPAFVTQCPRVQCQRGALIYADRDVGGGDLSGLYACEPIPVARPFADVAFIDEPLEAVYPPPTKDPWYRNLLRAPLVPQPDREDGFVFRQSLGVYLLAPNGREDEIRAALDQKLAEMPALVRGRLRAHPDDRRSLRDAVGVDPETATYLQLEMPLFVGLPPAETWNQSALAAGLDGRVQPFVDDEDARLPAVSVQNVLLQFSPLEFGFISPDAAYWRVEAAWLVREADTFKFTVFGTVKPQGDFISWGPLDIVFSPENRRFELDDNGTWRPLLTADLPRELIKAFFVTLEIVRGLTPGFKPDAMPRLSMGLGDRRSTQVAVRGVSTVLARARRDPEDMRLHFLRYADSREPYAGPRNEMPSIALLKLVSGKPYAELGGLREIYGHAHEVEECGIGIPMPGRGDEEFAPNIAKYLLGRYPPEGDRDE